MKQFFSLLLIIITNSFFSQDLQLEDIMKGNEFIGYQPVNQKWSVDGKTIFFDWNPNNNISDEKYYWKEGFSQPKALPLEEYPFQAIDYIGQEQYDIVYYTYQNVLFSYNQITKENRIIYQSSNAISNIQRSSVPEIVYFQQENNLFKLNAKNFQLLQVSNFKSGKKSEENKKTSFLENQQEDLFKFIQEGKEKTKWNENFTKKSKIKFPLEIYYEENSLESLNINPNGNYVTFRISEYAKSKPTKIAQFISRNGQVDTKSARDKVSIDNLSKHKMGIYNIEKDTIYYVSFSNLSGINKLPKYYQEYENLKNTKETEKGIIMEPPVYNKTGDLAVFEARSLDNKDRWILQLNLSNGQINEIDHQHDEAWIGGPGIPTYSFDSGTLAFLNDNKTIYFQSEESGFSHLYTYNLETKNKTQLTKGNWEVRDVIASKKQNAFYISTTSTHPGNRSFYKLDISSKKMIPILTNDGSYQVSLSPDESKLLIRYSYSNKPWELYVADNKPNAEMKQITFSTKESFKKYNWRIPEGITFKATDGTNINARVYNPKAEKKNNAAIIFVHGAGYLQNAHHFWSSYYREYMFHNLLCDLGYTILDIDYRGSDGYGRDFRTGIYRHMGSGLDLSDHIDGKKYLIEKIGINANKIGIYGGSYGGLITLMALLTKPGEFKVGGALRSVTDYAHYNQGYTSNILNFPETDPKAYKRSSPIYFAENLKDKLLMFHGMVDDNVQFQDIIRLTERFIELGKKDWDLAVYPVEAHAFVKTYSWIDEYRRILELFNKNLLEK
jgi:dipeptidyl aminopeptidase/acylaminoacyl peptidase